MFYFDSQYKVMSNLVKCKVSVRTFDTLEFTKLDFFTRKSYKELGDLTNLIIKGDETVGKLYNFENTVSIICMSKRVLIR